MKTCILFWLLLSLSVPVQAAGKWKRAWKVSVVAVSTALATDSASSWGRPEGNSLIYGTGHTFGGRELAIKAGVAGGLLGLEYWAVRRCRYQPKPEQAEQKAYKYEAAGNFAVTGFLGWATYHNLQIPKGR